MRNTIYRLPSEGFIQSMFADAISFGFGIDFAAAAASDETASEAADLAALCLCEADLLDRSDIAPLASLIGQPSLSDLERSVRYVQSEMSRWHVLFQCGEPLFCEEWYEAHCG